eukprot:jgi/Tetstr1/453781/TSEL_040733.t1
MLSPLPKAAATSPANRSGIIHCSPAGPFPACSKGELLSAVLDERFTLNLTEKQLTDAMNVARDIIGICETRLQHKTGSKYPTVYNMKIADAAKAREAAKEKAQAGVQKAEKEPQVATTTLNKLQATLDQADVKISNAESQLDVLLEKLEAAQAKHNEAKRFQAARAGAALETAAKAGEKKEQQVNKAHEEVANAMCRKTELAEAVAEAKLSVLGAHVKVADAKIAAWQDSSARERQDARDEMSVFDSSDSEKGEEEIEEGEKEDGEQGEDELDPAYIDEDDEWLNW